ncbi:AraC family transcriptional regulator [Flavobacterium sp. 140616W15]|uniref:helix-turn-helix domain-containing protein n=1 Tax=Flavobacterium sp. 140616W15 TaxID=2478552 RepID=UPI001F5E1E5E|nr:helix-turn-helix domain-containing protein [Flavobacterium sp. 140616W15]
MLNNEDVSEAICIASPELHQEMLKIINNDSLEVSKSLILSLAKYVIRMGARCTPFGLFSGCSMFNWRFGKTFSEYSNELKINYVINELIANPKYRKYSTQALAESVGFKNAVSFTKSFSKRTGVTPTQFTKKLETTEF